MKTVEQESQQVISFTKAMRTLAKKLSELRELTKGLQKNREHLFKKKSLVCKQVCDILTCPISHFFHLMNFAISLKTNMLQSVKMNSTLVSRKGHKRISVHSKPNS